MPCIPDHSPDQETVLVKVDLDKLPESRGVVVPHRARVAERLQNRVALQHLEGDTTMKTMMDFAINGYSVQGALDSSELESQDKPTLRRQLQEIALVLWSHQTFVRNCVGPLRSTA